MRQVYSKPKYHNYMRNGGPQQPEFQEDRGIKKYGNIFGHQRKSNVRSQQNLHIRPIADIYAAASPIARSKLPQLQNPPTPNYLHRS